jgi:hypothetical protein
MARPLMPLHEQVQHLQSKGGIRGTQSTLPTGI